MSCVSTVHLICNSDYGKLRQRDTKVQYILYQFNGKGFNTRIGRQAGDPSL